jgi:putative toxin-antitoxin system antitoxin component (TIGR02293 family)
MATVQAEEETKRVITLLGGRAVLRRNIRNAGAMKEALREGLPFGAFEALLQALEVRSQELADLIGVASRTLARRKTARQMSPIESDRLYRVAYITALASSVLGSLEKGREWLRRDNRALGGEPPIRYLDTEIGERQVEEILNRINYGIHG